MQRDELSAWLRLSLTPGVGNETARKLLAAFGLPPAIFRQPAAALGQVVSRAQAIELQKTPPELNNLVEVTWAWLQAAPTAGAGSNDKTVQSAPPEHRQIVVLGDANYPASLLNIEDPPLMLYLLCAGGVPEADFFSRSCLRSIAVVGSRNPTPQGLETAHQFSRALRESGLTVVSVLALGVDGAAHKGAIEGANEGVLQSAADGQLATIAVVGTGLDRVYPKGHRTLAHAIALHGLIVSEYHLGTPPLPLNFPKRNRIIAGLTQGTLVVEAALQSGSLITARLAAEQGKEVFAIPGSIHSGQSRGCHALIRQGAKLVETVQDILEDMKPGYGVKTSSIQAADSIPLEPLDETDALIQALGYDPVSLDALQARTGLDTPSLQARLMTLELDGQLARLPGGLFQRIGTA